MRPHPASSSAPGHQTGERAAAIRFFDNDFGDAQRDFPTSSEPPSSICRIGRRRLSTQTSPAGGPWFTDSTNSRPLQKGARPVSTGRVEGSRTALAFTAAKWLLFPAVDHGSKQCHLHGFQALIIRVSQPVVRYGTATANPGIRGQQVAGLFNQRLFYPCLPAGQPQSRQPPP